MKFGVLSNYTALIAKLKVTQNIEGMDSVEMHAPLPNEHLGGEIEIFVKTLTCKTIHINIDSNGYIEELKGKIQD